MDPDTLRFLIFGYLFTIAIETPILLVGLSRRHSLGRRVFAGIWLSACTYPIVVVVLPEIFDTGTQRFLYLLVAETFAPVAECALFAVAFLQDDFRPTATNRKGPFLRDMIAIILANLASFGAGEAMHWKKIPIPGTELPAAAPVTERL